MVAKLKIMKAKSIVLFTAAFAFLFTMTAAASAATNDVSGLLQKGLFEEEANRNLEAAIQAYQGVIAETDKDHQFAATAIFRLAECYRKLGRTNEATAQYQRVIRDFSDQTELVRLSRDYTGISNSASPTNSSFQERLEHILKQNNESEEDKEVKRIQALLKDSPDLVNAYNGLVTPLLVAVSREQPKVVTFLLDNKADTEVRDKRNDQTPLMEATGLGNVQILEMLLRHGADVNARNLGQKQIDPGAGNTALHYAAELGFKTVAETLINHGATVNAQNAHGKTPLQLTAEKGFKAVAELLLSHQADVQIKDSEGVTALQTAVRAGNRAIVELLLANKADVNSTDAHGWTALATAAQNGNIGIMELLLAAKANVNSANDYGVTPLIAASFAPAHLDAARLLLEHGAGVNARIAQTSSYTTGYTALHLAIAHNNDQLLEQLLDHKADVNIPVDYLDNSNIRGSTPLIMATYKSEPDIVRLLLDHQADPNRISQTGATPLHWAAGQNVQKDWKVIAELLLTHGAEVNARDEKGQTPLHWAVRNNNRGLVELLLAHHADVNARDNDGNAPLDLSPRQTVNNVSVRGIPQPAPGVIAPPSLSYQWYAQPSSSGGETNASGSISDILRAHGAVTELESGTIRYVRKGMEPQVVFRRNVPLQDNVTLFDLIAQVYIYAVSGQSEVRGLSFPDFAKIKIFRQPGDGTNFLSEDLESIFKAGDCNKNISLHWGDVVEIPEADHNVNDRWTGLSEPVRETLKKCLEHPVQITIKGHPISVNIAAQASYITITNGATYHHGPSLSKNTERPQVLSPWLREVVNKANVVLASSDLTRVKVTRTDPGTHKTESAVFNLEQDLPNNRLLLRDGDVIEIPEKE